MKIAAILVAAVVVSGILWLCALFAENAAAREREERELRRAAQRWEKP